MTPFQTEQEEKFNICIAILAHYNGHPSINNICKEIIKFKVDDAYNVKLMNIMKRTGVVDGEFGFMNAYKQKIEQVLAWLEDPDEKVRKFTEIYIAHLDKCVISEKRRAEEITELNVRHFRNREL